MKRITAIVLLLISTTTRGQESTTPFDGHTWKAPYTLPTPKDWGIERFLLPASFAPAIPYKGVEDIRFAPGWANSQSEEYWSYAFLWYLEGKVSINAAMIDSNLYHYYTGLVGINGSNIPQEKIIPVTTSFKEAATENGDLKTYTGTVKMTDYMTGRPITLQAKVNLKSCPETNKSFVFYQLSPQPFSHTIWQGLGQLRKGFGCEIN